MLHVDVGELGGSRMHTHGVGERKEGAACQGSVGMLGSSALWAPPPFTPRSAPGPTPLQGLFYSEYLLLPLFR